MSKLELAQNILATIALYALIWLLWCVLPSSPSTDQDILWMHYHGEAQNDR